MSMRQVAQLAGVSISTVSRVINDHPNIADSTSQSVRQAMAQLKFVPVGRSVVRPTRRPAGLQRSIGFLVFGTASTHATPAFNKLLRGVSDAAANLNADLVFGYVNSPDDLPRSVTASEVNGLLLHGQRPSPAVQHQLKNVPTVWLMANRERPAWGDQVMPNNPVIGEVAAKYLMQHGHRHLACLKVANDGWSLRLRAWAFAEAAGEVGVPTRILQAVEPSNDDLWCAVGLGAVANQLVDQWLAQSPRPTGVFVTEHRLLPAIEAAFAAKGVRVGHGADVQIISCNNERVEWNGSKHPPVTVDVRADVIGRRGVELLLWRMQNPDAAGRVSLLIEPVLVEAERGITRTE